MKIITSARRFNWLYGFLMALFLSGISSLNAQDRLIKGSVTHDGKHLNGVHVNNKSLGLNIFTDKKGFYEISGAAGDVLVFSYIGYETQEIIIKANNKIDVELQLEHTELDAVQLTTGYYSLKERTLTGNVTKISQKDFENQVVQSPLEALQGRVAGLEVQSMTGMSGQAPKVTIRGQTSIRGEISSQPLYVLDGVPINNKGIRTTNGIYDTETGLNPLATLNSSLIESIEVLKDADATAIYGSRGANGVIIINTKGGKPKETKFQMQAETGISWVGKFLKLMNTGQYLEMRREAFENDGVESTPANAPDLLLWDQNRYTDWQKELIGHHSEFQKYQGALNGGNDQTSFLLSGGFQKETTIFPGEYATQDNNLYANINHHSKDNKLHLTSSINYAYRKNNLFDAGLFVANGVRLSPNAPELFDSNENINWELDEFGNPSFINPLAGILNPNIIRMKTFQWNGGLSYELLDDLYLKVNIGINDLNIKNKQIRFKRNLNPLNQATGRSSTNVRNIERKHILVEPQINYIFKRDGHKVEALLGGTFQENEETELHVDALGYASESQVGNLALANEVNIITDRLTEYRYTAIFGRIGYSYANKYYLNLIGRRDGSSRFGTRNRFGNFGAVGGAWNFFKEAFTIDHLEWLNYGKLRASYGITGSDDIGDYQYLDLYQQIALYPGSLSLGGIIPQKLNNPYYQWEKIRNWK